MRRGPFAIVLCALGVLLTYGRPEAKINADDRRTFDSASLREFLEGSTGKRDAWKAAPALTIVSAVMDYASGDLASGFIASGETIFRAHSQS
jgi:hypothetical protein